MVDFSTPLQIPGAADTPPESVPVPEAVSLGYEMIFIVLSVHKLGIPPTFVCVCVCVCVLVSALFDS